MSWKKIMFCYYFFQTAFREKQILNILYRLLSSHNNNYSVLVFPEINFTQFLNVKFLFEKLKIIELYSSNSEFEIFQFSEKFIKISDFSALILWNITVHFVQLKIFLRNSTVFSSWWNKLKLQSYKLPINSFSILTKYIQPRFWKIKHKQLLWLI